MDKVQTQATVLIIPGLRDHVPEHWQTHLESQLAKVQSVPALQVDKLNCAKRLEAIQIQLEKIDGPVILIAHSAGVLMVVHWAAQYYSKQQQIQAALLVTPPNLAQTWPENYPTAKTLHEQGWLPLPLQKLPFPSLVVASRNDPLAHYDAVLEMAQKWGSELLDLGEVGHMNPAAGFGPWPKAVQLVQQLDRTTTNTAINA